MSLIESLFPFRVVYKNNFIYLLIPHFKTLKLKQNGAALSLAVARGIFKKNSNYLISLQLLKLDFHNLTAVVCILTTHNSRTITKKEKFSHLLKRDLTREVTLIYLWNGRLQKGVHHRLVLKVRGNLSTKTI